MTDWGWVSRELAGAKVTGTDAEGVVQVLKLLDDLKIVDQKAAEVLAFAYELAIGHSIAVAEVEERWGPVRPGEYRVGDTVRVRSDAFDGDKGVLHNGKRGRVVAARDGFVLVVHDGQLNIDIQHRYRPESLQRLV